MNSTSHNAFAFMVDSLLHPPVQAQTAAAILAETNKLIEANKPKIVQTVGRGKRVW